MDDEEIEIKSAEPKPRMMKMAAPKREKNKYQRRKKQEEENLKRED